MIIDSFVVFALVFPRNSPVVVSKSILRIESDYLAVIVDGFVVFAFQPPNKAPANVGTSVVSASFVSNRIRERLWLKDRNAQPCLSNINPLLKKKPKPVATPAPTVKTFKPKKVGFG